MLCQTTPLKTVRIEIKIEIFNIDKMKQIPVVVILQQFISGILKLPIVIVTNMA